MPARIDLPKEELIGMYMRKGLSTVEIAAYYGVTHTTVNRKLKEAGTILREPGDKKNLPQDELSELYLKQNLGLDEIAERYGVSPGCVSDYMRKYGIAVRMNNIKVLPKDVLYDMYVNKKISMENCGKHFGVSIMGIKNNLKRYGIPVRSLRESHLGKYNAGTGFKKGQKPHNARELPVDEIAEMYRGGKSSVEIGKFFGVGHKVILNRLRIAGVALLDQAIWLKRVGRTTRNNYVNNNGTPAEKLFERYLIEFNADVGCYREYRIEDGNRRRRYRIDFAWPDKKLAIELDGGIHYIIQMQERDAIRDSYLNIHGWNILRIKNEWLFKYREKLMHCLIKYYIQGGE